MIDTLTALTRQAGYGIDDPLVVGFRRGGAPPVFFGSGGSGGPGAGTVVYTASLSKLITAAGAALLVGQGRLDTGSTLARWMPELPGWAAGVRVRHLIHHISGIPEGLDFYDHQRAGLDRTTGDVLRALAGIDHLAASPGTQVASPGADVPSPGTDVPSPGTQVASAGAEVASPGADVPSSGTQVASAGAEVASPGADVPSSGTQVASPGAEVASPGTDVASPGTEFRYCNAGYVCLAVVVERAAGQPLADFAREHMFEPLGMPGTRYWSGPAPHPPGSSPLPAEYPAPLSLGDGGVWSTARDLMRWNEALERDELGISALLYTPGRLDDGTRLEYGWGVDVVTRAGHPVHKHGGRWAGLSAQLVRLPDQRSGFVVLALDDDEDRTVRLSEVLIDLCFSEEQASCAGGGSSMD